MAIDTQQKRRSIVNVACPWRSNLPIGDGAIGQADRQHFLGYYSGVLWSAVSTYSVTVDPFNVTEITLVRAADRASATPFTLGCLVATILYDFIYGWDGSLYNLTGWTESRDLDCDDPEDARDVFDVAATLVNDNPSTSFNAIGFTTANATAIYTLAIPSANLNQIADLLAMLLGREGARPFRGAAASFVRLGGSAVSIQGLGARAVSISRA